MFIYWLQFLQIKILIMNLTVPQKSNVPKYVDLTYKYRAVNHRNDYLTFNDAQDMEVLILSRNNQIRSNELINFPANRWDKLTSLSLTNNRICSKGCKYLSRASLPKILYIVLNSNHIDGSGMLHLEKSEWKNIEKISLRANLVISEGVEWLVRSNWPKLKEIDLSQNLLTKLDLLILIDNSKKMRLVELYGNLEEVYRRKMQVKERLERKFDYALIRF